MPKFTVEVYREWKELGQIEINANSEDEAREEAREALSEDSGEIEWHSENMEPGDQGVEQITEE
jgi:hypothetical protein